MPLQKSINNPICNRGVAQSRGGRRGKSQERLFLPALSAPPREHHLRGKHFSCQRGKVASQTAARSCRPFLVLEQARPRGLRYRHEEAVTGVVFVPLCAPDRRICQRFLPLSESFCLDGQLPLVRAGTLLIRELRVRWGKGWPSVLILAAAYMVAEEGLMLNTLFDPNQNTAGRFLGVNWVWTAGMLLVHSFVSIFAPILLAESIFDAQAGEPWIKRSTFWWLVLAFVANVFGLGRLIAPFSSARPCLLSRRGALYRVLLMAGLEGPRSGGGRSRPGTLAPSALCYGRGLHGADDGAGFRHAGCIDSSGRQDGGHAVRFYGAFWACCGGAGCSDYRG